MEGDEVRQIDEDYYEAAFVEHFTDYDVLRNIAQIVSSGERMWNGQAPELHFQAVADLYLSKTGEKSFNTPVGEDAMYITQYSITIDNTTKTPSKIFAIVTNVDLATFLVHKYDVAYYEYKLKKIGKMRGTVDDQNLESGAKVSGNKAVNEALTSLLQKLDDPNTNAQDDPNTNAQDAPNEKKAEYLAESMRRDTAEEASDNEFSTASRDASERKYEFEEVIRVLQTRKKKFDDNVFITLQGKINRYDSAKVAYEAITEIIKQYEYSDNQSHKTSLIGIGNMFRKKFVTNTSYAYDYINNISNKKYSTLLWEEIGKKIDPRPPPSTEADEAGTTGGASRDASSPWSWFWIAQGFVVVLATTVIQSVK
jgi:hypothetical protein